MPSVSLSKFTGKADVTAKDNDVVKAKLGKISYGAQGTLEASLPEGLVGKISFTDATINSVRLRLERSRWRCGSDLMPREPYGPQVKDKPTSLQPAGVNIEIAKPGARPPPPVPGPRTARGAVPGGHDGSVRNDRAAPAASRAFSESTAA